MTRCRASSVAIIVGNYTIAIQSVPIYVVVDGEAFKVMNEKSSQ